MFFRSFGDVNFVKGYDIPRDLNGYNECPLPEGETPAPPRVLLPAAPSTPKPFWYFVAGFVLCRFLTK